MEKLFQQYGPQGLTVLRIDTKEPPEVIQKHLEKQPSFIPILLDRTGKVGRLFGLWAHPTSYLIDRQGLVRARAIGSVEWGSQDVLVFIDQLVKEK